MDISRDGTRLTNAHDPVPLKCVSKLKVTHPGTTHVDGCDLVFGGHANDPTNPHLVLKIHFSRPAIGGGD